MVRVQSWQILRPRRLLRLRNWGSVSRGRSKLPLRFHWNVYFLSLYMTIFSMITRFRECVQTSSALPLHPRGETPLPEIRWADRQEIWDLMCKKERGMYLRQSGDDILGRHPCFQPRYVIQKWIYDTIKKLPYFLIITNLTIIWLSGWELSFSIGSLKCAKCTNYTGKHFTWQWISLTVFWALPIICQRLEFN